MTSKSLLGINLLSPVLFYQNPVDIAQTINGSTQMTGIPTEMNSCRGCNRNLASNNPASQYQRQKLIQNTVRVYASLYTMNLAGLAGYERPLREPQLVEQAGTPYIVPPNVYWNQMSDRARPSNQVAKVASGSTYHTSSTRHTITRNRPGAMSPGGIGVDIKHNSYDRYLNKLKGKAPLRRGVIPPNYGAPIPYNRAYPIYGGKIVKTAIINGCDCPDNSEQDKFIYADTSNALQDNILSITYEFHVGDNVWAKKFQSESVLYKGTIMEIDKGIYTVKFEDDTIREFVYSDLLIYFECNCDQDIPIKEKAVGEPPNELNVVSEMNAEYEIACGLLNILSTVGAVVY